MYNRKVPTVRASATERGTYFLEVAKVIREHTVETLREFTYAKTLRIPSGEGPVVGTLDGI
jgi:hypothetical protein